MGIRTPDLLHAIQWHHVHSSAPVQVTVLERPHESVEICACCGTSLLYESRPLLPRVNCTIRPLDTAAGPQIPE
jgi:hypothetical protein